MHKAASDLSTFHTIPQCSQPEEVTVKLSITCETCTGACMGYVAQPVVLGWLGEQQRSERRKDHHKDGPGFTAVPPSEPATQHYYKPGLESGPSFPFQFIANHPNGWDSAVLHTSQLYAAYYVYSQQLIRTSTHGSGVLDTARELRRNVPLMHVECEPFRETAAKQCLQQRTTATQQ